MINVRDDRRRMTNYKCSIGDWEMTSRPFHGLLIDDLLTVEIVIEFGVQNSGHHALISEFCGGWWNSELHYLSVWAKVPRRERISISICPCRYSVVVDGK
jgi:hypothetical protein